MKPGVELFRVRSLPDDALLLGLSRSLRASRNAVAEVVAHLGEVEERRLHLLGGYSSMFDYCVRRLNMSEDEAYRRIEVARLVRRFPRLLEALARGQLSLSVAVSLKARLTEENHEALLANVSGKTVAQAREVLAAWFPQPDVAPLLRKLPARAAPPAAGVQTSARSAACDVPSADVARPPDAAPTEGRIPSAANPPGAPAAQPTEPVPTKPIPTEPIPTMQPMMPGRASSAPGGASPSRSLKPLSPERYKLQLTVTTNLKQKLDLARDLLRHAVPGGDLPTIIERALDLLLEQTTRRRFAPTLTKPPHSNRSKTKPPRAALAETKAAPTPVPVAPALTAEPPAAEPPATPALATAEPPAAEPAASTLAAIEPSACAPSTALPSRASRHIPNETRRAVLERDGMQCTWQAPDGTRCNSRAWLEHDHIIPRGKGGSNDPLNCRILCRPHNRLAAELAYGRNTITRSIAHRRNHHAPTRPEVAPSTHEVESRTSSPSP